MADELNAYEPPDRLADAVSAARNALKSRFVDSLSVAVSPVLGAFVAVAAIVSVLYQVNGITAESAVAALSAAVLVVPLSMVVLEFKRLHDRSDALAELVNTLRQFEVLIRDARDERNQLKSANAQLAQENASLRVLSHVIVASRSTIDE